MTHQLFSLVEAHLFMQVGLGGWLRGLLVGAAGRFLVTLQARGWGGSLGGAVRFQ